MSNNSQTWIRLIPETDEHTHDDHYNLSRAAQHQEETRNLEDRVELLEQIILVLRKEIRDLNKQLRTYRGIDISAVSNLDFWLTEEDDIWDTI